MIMSRFRSVGLAAGAAASVLCCYMVSLRVASERGEVEKLQGRIIATRHEMRQLQTELDTRGRMRQLERWNADVLALSAPRAEQYLTGEVALANYYRGPQPGADAKVVPAVVEPRPAPPTLPPQAVSTSYTPPAAARHEAPLLHTTAYLKDDDSVAGDTHAAPLDDTVIADISKLAAGERRGAKRKAAE